MQPERACYIERAADAELARGLRDQRFCYVLAPRASGKSSLVAHAITALRQSGQLAAVVDLSQIGLRGTGSDAGRWYYGIAYRIIRELRLKFDLRAFWQEKSGLPNEQRLAEFFAEVVLANTSTPVTVFFDEVERALDKPFAPELFAILRSCYARRISEPEYARLNFVVLGVASPRSLAPDPAVSPFVEGQPIELKDFTLEECLELAPGFETDEATAHAILERIHAWTAGQPYMTQKVARGVARRGSRLEAVDRVVREQFLGPGAAMGEPLLNHVRTLLTGSGQRARHALLLLGRIARGVSVHDEPGASPPKDLLRLSGVVAPRDGRLHYRNRIVAEVFDARWVRSRHPFDGRRAAAAAALAAVAVAFGFWYVEILPRPYERTLAVVTGDLAVAEDAYAKLHRLPGFGGRADRLLAAALTRRSRAAGDYTQMRAADAVLRRLPGRARQADELEGDYWLRRANEAMHGGRRDEALLFALQALPGRPDRVRGLAGELVAADYRLLAASFRLPSAPPHWAVDWGAHRLTVVDSAHRPARLVLPPAADGDAGAAAAAGPKATGAGAASPRRLTALQHVPVMRELSVEDAGQAGAFRLEAEIHGAEGNNLLATLTAPSGESASLPLAGASAHGLYVLEAKGASPLARLAGQKRRGVWRLTLVDRVAGTTAELVRWGLRFGKGANAVRDAPAQPVPIPDPVRTEQVHLTLSPDGRRAAAVPARAGADGEIAVWDLASGRLLHDLSLPDAPELVVFNADGSRLLVLAGRVLTIWDVARGRAVARHTTPTRYMLPPAVGLDGDFVALAEEVAGAVPRVSILRLADGRIIASTKGVRDARAWVLGPQARYLAVLAAPREVVVTDPRGSGPWRDIEYERDLRRLLAVPGGDLLLTVDTAGEVRVRRLPPPGKRAAAAETWRLGTTVAAASVAVSADGSTAAFAGERGKVEVRDVQADLLPVYLRVEGEGAKTRAALSADGKALVTDSGNVFRLWRLGPREIDKGTDAGISAITLDADGGLAVLGFRGGHIRVRSASELARALPGGESVDYIGHRGRVTALAVNAGANLIASGGEDGVVRVWDLASVAPAPQFMRHPVGPIQAVAISADGRWIVSAAEYSARAWHTRDGKLAAELPVNGTALAVAISPDSSRWAVGDSAGNVFFGAPQGKAPLGSVRAQGPVLALAFSPDGRLAASGDATGNVELWDARQYAAVGARAAFPHAVRWLAFGPDGRYLLIETNHWLHRAEIDGGRLTLVDSRLLGTGLERGGALAAPDGSRLRLVVGRAAGHPKLLNLDLEAPPGPPLPAGSPQLRRDWPRVLALAIDSAGRPVPVPSLGP